MRIFNSIIFCLAAALPLLVASCSHSDPRTQALIDLRDEVEDQLDELEPGDWIIIGPSSAMEASVPAQQARHIHVLANNVNTLRQTLDLMERDDRLSPRLWVCQEQQTSSHTPGAARMRTHLQDLLSGRPHYALNERVILLQLTNQPIPRRFHFIHTDTTLPHSSICIELDYAGESAVPTSAPRT
jgi:hypothetical protein